MDEGRCKEVTRFLKSLGLPQKEVVTLLDACPSTLSHSAAELAAAADGLCDLLGLDDAAIARLAVKHPAALQAQPAQLLQLAGFFEGLGAAPGAAGAALLGAPALLSTPHAELEQRAALLHSLGLQPAAVVQSCPAVLGPPLGAPRAPRLP